MGSATRVLCRGLHWGLHWVGGAVLLVGLVLALLLWVLRNGPLPAPDWVADRLKHRVETALAPFGLQAEIGAVAFDLRQRGTPAITAMDVRLRDASGRDTVALSRLEAVLAPDGLFSGDVSLGALRASGLTVTLRRDAEGRLSLDLGERQVITAAPGPAEMLTALRRMLDAPRLRRMRILGVEDVTFRLQDAARRETMSSRGGVLRIARQGAALALTLDAGRIGPGEVGRALLELHSPGAEDDLSARIALRGLVPAEMAGLAGRTPLSDLLARFDAPVSLLLSGVMGPEGRWRDTGGELSVGAGQLQLPGRAAPLPLDWLQADLALGPSGDALQISALDLSAPALRLKGAAELRRIGAPDTAARFTAQVALSEVALAVPELLHAPQQFDGLWATLAYERGRDRLQIADLSLQQGAVRVHASGHASGLAGPDPVLALDLQAPVFAPGTLLAFWPAGRGEGGRRWIANNLHAAEITDLRGAVRLQGGGRPQLGLSFAFSGARLTAARGLPEISDGRGIGQIADGTLSFAIDTARMQAAEGAPIALSEGVVRIAPIFVKGAGLQARFHASADVSAALSLLASEAFNRRRQSSSPPSVLAPGDATGQVTADLRFDVPLRKGTKMAQVDFALGGQITDLASDRLVQNRRLTARALSLSASPKGVHIAGPVALDGHAFRASFDRPLGRAPNPLAPSRIVARGALTAALAGDFGVRLPEGATRGAGTLTAHVTLPRGGAPQLALDGDLTGVSLRLPGIGLRKRADQAGSLQVAGRLGPGGQLDVIRLRVPGLSLDGSVPLREGGGTGPLTMRRVAIGSWLDATGTLTSGAGRGLRVALTGGQVDLRSKPKGGGGGRLQGLDLTLDTVRVNDRIALRDVRGRLNGRGHGGLEARLNGAVPVSLRLAPGRQGTAIDITASDAGAVMSAADLTQGLRGGDFFLRLVPTGAAETYRGQLRIANTALREASTAARIVSALSVVGAFEQMSGGGIKFGDIRSDFTLSPTRAQIHSGSAVGASLGLSFDGSVDLARKRLDLQGVVSPLYFINRAGSFMTRRGEGLLGLSYTIRGGFDDPKVAANPLSVLAPGFLREIFRSRAESPAGAGQE